MAFDTPQSTNEAILQNMLGASNTLKPPQSRVEKLLQELSGQMPEANPSEGTTTGTLERLKIGDNIYSVKGGGSGTSDYDALNNKPQIAGTTLSGNKSLADLGIASASAVSDILDGTDIDSFGDVETALAGKQGTLTFDSAPTSESTNPVTSGGVYTALAGKVDKTSVGVASGVAELDSNGKVPSAQLPSYVDDVVNGYLHDGKFYADDQYTTEITGEEGKIYVDLATNKTYRWSGLAFVEISESLALGETSSTAYAGDKGKANADAISDIKDGQTIDSFADVESALAGKQGTLTFDNVPTENSTNPVKSGGIYSTLAGKADTGIVADDFDSTASYVIGNYCIENGKLYRFKANHSGTWSSANVDEIQITGELATLKSGLTNLDNEVNGDATTYPYADVITINDAVPANLADCSVKVEPVQDLHGYDKPWVGGANKNKINIADKASSTSGDVTASCSNGVITLSGTASAQTTFSFPLGSDINLTPSLYKIAYNNTASSSYIAVKFCNDGRVIHSWTPNVVNRVISDWTAAEDETIDEIKIEIATGYPTNMTLSIVVMDKDGTDTSFSPWSNICPITGHTEVDVQRDGGKNLLNVNAPDVIVGKTVLYDGTLIEAEHVNVSGYIYVKDSAVLTYTSKTYNVYAFNRRIVCYDENKQFLGTCVQTTDTPTGIVTITGTVLANTKYVRVPFARDDASAEQLEYGTQATTYQPYQGKTYTIALGDTIYGGTVDFDSGVMTVDRAYFAPASVADIDNNATMPTDNWLVVVTDGKSSGGIISNQYVKGGVSTAGNCGITNSGKIRVKTYQTYNSKADAFDGELSGSEFVYELATPTTIQLTPQQIQLLKGQNTLTASTGQISVTANGVSGSIGQVQEQVNDIAEDVEDVQSGLTTLGTRVNGIYTRTFYNDTTSTTLNNVYLPKTDRHTIAIIAGNDICTMVVSSSAIVEQNNIRNQITVALNENNQFVVSGCPYYSRPMFIATYDFRQQPT